MVSRTTLKPRASLCELFFIFLLLNYYISSTPKLPLAQQYIHTHKKLERIEDLPLHKDVVLSSNRFHYKVEGRSLVSVQ